MSRKNIVPFILFFAVAWGAVLTWFAAGNFIFPAYKSGDCLPADWETNSYVITGVEYDAALGRYSFTVNVDGKQPPCLLAGIAVPFRLYMGDELVYAYTKNDAYTRLHLIELGDADPAVRSLELSVTLSKDADCKLLLGGKASIEAGIALTTNFYFFMYGVYLTIALTGVILYLGKKNELYTLLLTLYCMVCALATFFTLNTPLSYPSFGQYSPFRAWLFLATNLLGVAVCWLINGKLPGTVRARKYSAAVGAALVCSLLAVCLLAGERTINFMSDVVFLLGLWALAKGYEKDPRASAVLLCGYGLSHGLRLVWSLARWGSMPSPAMFAYIRLPLFDNIPFLLACMVVVLSRFSSKFKEAERLNEQLKEINATLDIRILERTAQLELQEQKKHNMMTNIFHDLRNPIFAIRGCLDMMEVTSSQNQRLRGIMKERLTVMGNLVENLFFISKLEEDKITFVNEKQDMGALCTECILAEAAKAQSKGVALESELAPDMFVLGDAFRLKQAIGNLLQNAIEHTPEAGRVKLMLYRRDSFICICVEDTGEGIAPQDIPYIFNRYYTPRLADRQKSSGLGLAISNEIIRIQGGEISVESRLGEGSRFTVQLTAFTPQGEDDGEENERNST